MKIDHYQNLVAERVASFTHASLESAPGNDPCTQTKDTFETTQKKSSPSFLIQANPTLSINRIFQLFNLTITDHKALGGGENFVYLINGQLIFRLPKSESARIANRREQILLSELRYCVKSTHIPVYNFWDHEHGVGGYHEIKGIALSYKFYNSLSAAQKDLLARDLALSISEIHSLAKEKVPLNNCLSEIREYMNLVNSSLERHSIFAQPAVKKIKEALLIIEQRIYARNAITVVIHSDLHCDNIIVDPSSKVLSGIIDFSDARIGPAVVDFSNLYRVNPQLAENAAAIYAHQKKLDERAFLEELRAWSLVWLAACIAHNYNGPSLREQKRVMRAGRAFNYLIALKKF